MIAATQDALVSISSWIELSLVVKATILLAAGLTAVLLARKLSSPHAPAMLGMANRSDLARRVAALLDDRQPRGRAGITVAVATLLVATLMVTTIAPLRAVSSRSAGAAADERSNRESSSTRDVSNDRSTEQRRVRALDRALYEAAERGVIDEVNELLQAGANIDAVISGDGSPLIGAVRSGRLALVRLLLDRGANVNLPVSGDGNPLIVAAGEGHATIVELLLDRGASVDQIVPGDENALIQASREGHLEVVKLLVSRGADLNLGVWADTVSMSRISGENVTQQNREWRSPLSMARKNRRTAVVQFLISAGARE